LQKSAQLILLHGNPINCGIENFEPFFGFSSWISRRIKSRKTAARRMERFVVFLEHFIPAFSVDFYFWKSLQFSPKFHFFPKEVFFYSSTIQNRKLNWKIWPIFRFRAFLNRSPGEFRTDALNFEPVNIFSFWKKNNNI